MRSRTVLVVRILTLLAALVVFHWLVVAPWQCMRAIVFIEQGTRFALAHAKESEARRIAASNLKSLKEISGHCRTDVDLYLLLGFNARILGRFDEALQHLEDGLKVDDRPELYINRGRILLEMGRVDDAVNELSTAVEFDPALMDRLDPPLRTRIRDEIGRRKATR